MLKSIGKAKKAQQAAEEQVLLETVIFKIDEESFGLDIFKVAEITKVMEITKLPRSLPFIEGIVNLRGRIIPVMDLRKRLGFAAAPRTALGRIIIVRMAGRRLGLLVDNVARVAGIPKDTIEIVPPATLQIDSEFIEGVGHLGAELVILIRLEKLLTQQEKEMLAEQHKPAGKGKA
jgi:purine-binding chemotaxis protein CheW